jgi:hypothetical protein
MKGAFRFWVDFKVSRHSSGSHFIFRAQCTVSLHSHLILTMTAIRYYVLSIHSFQILAILPPRSLGVYLTRIFIKNNCSIRKEQQRFSQAVCFIACRYASALLGISNTFGALPGILGVALAGVLLERTGDWASAVFLPIAAIQIFGTVIYTLFGSSQRRVDW